MSSLFRILPIAATLSLSPCAPAPSREIDNVSAFAHLYGVLRFFYPSDAAAGLDWNQFAVHGMSRVRAARNPADLEHALKQVVAPLGPGVEIGAHLSPRGPAVASSERLVAWHYLGAGFSTVGGPAYRAKRTHRATAGGAEGFVTIMQAVPAEALRGRPIRLRAQVRASAADESGAGALWLRVVKDAGFEEAADDGRGGWLREGPGSATVFRPTEGAPQGRQYLRIAQPPSSGPADAELFPEWAPSPGAHIDLDLGSGLKARVALALSDAQASLDPARRADLDVLRASLASVGGPSDTPGIDRRLADVVVVWSAFRHFYPYWTEAAVDWNSRLAPRLTEAAAAATRAAQHDALRGLVADARDGHGFVADTLDKTERGELPVRLAVVEGRLVVVSSGVPSEVPVGAVISTIDGLPAAERLASAMNLVSGTSQWRRVLAIRQLTSGAKGAARRLGFDDGKGPREATLRYGAPPPPEKRPGPVSELEAGISYVDLTRARMAEISPRLAALASARGVVFDLRGYPSDAGFGILPHLLATPESDRWMHVAKIVGPFYQTAGWLDLGWDVKPASPRIARKVVFLTDGGAISYAESVMGYVADCKLGTIVGSTTAGTNGNVVIFLTPGGFDVSFTGMRVTRHDGRSAFHLVGVPPDVAVAPTIEGLRAGRDEVLERGTEIVRASASGTDVPAR